MTNDPESSLASGLLQIGPHLPKVARVDPLPKGTPKGPAGHEVVYEHVFRRLTNKRPRQPASPLRVPESRPAPLDGKATGAVHGLRPSRASLHQAVNGE